MTTVSKWLCAVVGATAASAGVRSPPPLQAVITQIEGAVEAHGPGTGSPPLASLWQAIRAKATLRVPQGGSVGIVCSNRHFIDVRGPATWVLSGKACASGRELTPGEYRLLVPQVGRFRVVDGLLTVERELRGGAQENPLAPLVVDPRNTVIRSPRPTISWTSVPLAAEYSLHWSGWGAPRDERILDARRVDCSQQRGLTKICSVLWAPEAADLAPGRTYTLRVAARSGIDDPWHSEGSVEVKTQSLAAAESLEHDLVGLSDLGLRGSSLEIAGAGLLASRGLLTEAEGRYRSVWNRTRLRELQVTVADLDLMLRLERFAEALYRDLMSADSRSVRAAAAFGLGRVSVRRGQYHEAFVWFRESENLCSPEDGEEKAAASSAAEDARGRKAKASSPSAIPPSP